ncbi:MAG: hypothetical protein ABI380_02020 [Edaphobacter sp.]
MIFMSALVASMILLLKVPPLSLLHDPRRFVKDAWVEDNSLKRRVAVQFEPRVPGGVELLSVAAYT